MEYKDDELEEDVQLEETEVQYLRDGVEEPEEGRARSHSYPSRSFFPGRTRRQDQGRVGGRRVGRKGGGPDGSHGVGWGTRTGSDPWSAVVGHESLPVVPDGPVSRFLFAPRPLREDRVLS